MNRRNHNTSSSLLNNAGSLAELLIIFIGLPLLFFFEVLPVPKIPSLLGLTVFCFIMIWRDSSFRNKDLLSIQIPRKQVAWMLTRFLVFCLILFPAVWFWKPDEFLIFPRTNPQLWLLIMFLYPFLSALPQELIYRTYFFHRFRTLFPATLTMILASAFCFSFLHIIYDNYVAVVLTLGGGLLFSKTYADSRSLLFVSLEHALYGCAIFTSGLGRYFYEPFG